MSERFVVMLATFLISALITLFVIMFAGLILNMSLRWPAYVFGPLGIAIFAIGMMAGMKP